MQKSVKASAPSVTLREPTLATQQLCSRDRLLAAMKLHPPVTHEEAEMMNKAIMDAREQSMSYDVLI